MPSNDPQQPTCEQCGKRIFRSVHHARQAHRRAGFRLRAYWCNYAGGYHVSADDKRDDFERESATHDKEELEFRRRRDTRRRGRR